MNLNTLLPLPEPLSAFTWRPMDPGDIPEIQRMLAAAREVDGSEAAASEDRVRRIFGILGEQIAKNSLLALADDGTVAAAALVFIPAGADELVAFIEGIVDVKYRGRGLGSFILQWMETRARQEFSNPDEQIVPLLRTSCAGHQGERIALFEQSGFKAMRYSYKMRRNLEKPIQEQALSAGLQFLKWAPELDLSMMDAFNEAFSGQWGLLKINEDSWRKIFTGVPQFRGDLTFLVMNGDTVVAFCINWVEEAVIDQIATKEGWIEAVGVIPAWRTRGIASALLARALGLFRSEGLEWAGLDVDTQNPTGALRLYEKHGFEVARETIHFVKQLT